MPNVEPVRLYFSRPPRRPSSSSPSTIHDEQTIPALGSQVTIRAG
jgi:hypothetical protein